jgi:hypothetical protein
MPFGVSLIYGVDAKFLGHGIQQYSKLCGYNTLSVKGKALRSDLVQSSNNLRTSSLICALENLRSGKSDDGTGTSSGSGTNPGISGVAERLLLARLHFPCGGRCWPSEQARRAGRFRIRIQLRRRSGTGPKAPSAAQASAQPLRSGVLPWKGKEKFECQVNQSECKVKA